MLVSLVMAVVGFFLFLVGSYDHVAMEEDSPTHSPDTHRWVSVLCLYTENPYTEILTPRVRRQSLEDNEMRS